jgi:membrane protein
VKMKLKKYLKIFKINLSNQLEYRVNFIFSFFLSLFSLGANMLLWISVTKNSQTSEINKNYIISYYFIVLIVINATSANSLMQVSNEIRSGNLDKHLLKPYNYLLYNLMVDFAYRITFIFMNIIPIFIFYFSFNKYLTLYITKNRLLYFFIFLIFGYLINFFIDFWIGTFSFYFSKISSLYISIKILRNILAGTFFPLGILPKKIIFFLNQLPFMYTTYIPCRILTEQINDVEIFFYLKKLIFYFLILLTLCIFSWKKRVSNYISYGG